MPLNNTFSIIRIVSFWSAYSKLFILPKSKFQGELEFLLFFNDFELLLLVWGRDWSGASTDFKVCININIKII